MKHTHKYFLKMLKYVLCYKVEDHVSILGSGSDHAPFAFYAGIPSTYFSLGKKGIRAPGTWPRLSGIQEVGWSPEMAFRKPHPEIICTGYFVLKSRSLFPFSWHHVSLLVWNIAVPFLLADTKCVYSFV